jgi:hypothetical protein
VTEPVNGTVVLNTDGSFSYTPNTGYSGTDTFTYKANDGTADSNTATVTITINNTTPKANDDAYLTQRGVLLFVFTPGVLANDTDPDGDPLTAFITRGAFNGTVTLNTDGSFSYTPNAGYTGTDTFTYKANDGTADSNTATVTINITVPPVPGGGGGGGGTPESTPGVTNIGTNVNAIGEFTKSITALSDDNKISLIIELGTIGRAADGAPLNQIAILKTNNLKNTPQDINIISSMYEFGPSGVTFDPAVTVKFNYNPENIPSGVSETNLVIGYYDEKVATWTALDSIVDVVAHMVTAKTTHFTTFAVLSKSIENQPISTTNPPPVTPSVVPETLPPETTKPPVTVLPKKPLPAAFVLSDIKISPEVIYSGELINVSVSVTNVGDLTGIFRVIATIDGVEVAAKNVYLKGGTSEIVTLRLEQISEGHHTLEVNGTQQAIEVRPVFTEITPQQTNWTLILYIIIGMVTFWLGFLVSWRVFVKRK